MSHKYIRTKNHGFIIWPRNDDLWHVHIARAARSEVVSAGFVFFEDGEAVCYGESESLKMKSDSSDSAALTRQLAGPCK